MAPDAVQLVAGSGSTAAWSLGVPMVPALAGAALFWQAFAPDPQANPAGVAASAGGSWRLGW